MRASWVLSFGLLTGDGLRKGQQAITELERMLAILPGGSVDEVMGCNSALLLGHACSFELKYCSFEQPLLRQFRLAMVAVFNMFLTREKASYRV